MRGFRTRYHQVAASKCWLHPRDPVITKCRMDMTKCRPPADVLPSTSLMVHPCTPAHTSTLHHYHTINILHSHNFALRQRLQAHPNMFSKVAAIALMGLAGVANARSLVSGLAVPVVYII